MFTLGKVFLFEAVLSGCRIACCAMKSGQLAMLISYSTVGSSIHVRTLLTILEIWYFIIFCELEIDCDKFLAIQTYTFDRSLSPSISTRE